MDIEKLKSRYLENIDELEKEVRILLRRIEKSRKEIPDISTAEDVSNFVKNNDLKNGLKHIELLE